MSNLNNDFRFLMHSTNVCVRWVTTLFDSKLLTINERSLNRWLWKIRFFVMRYTFLFAIRLCHVETDMRAAGADAETFFLRLGEQNLGARGLTPLLSTLMPGNALSAPALPSLPAPPPELPPDNFDSERQAFLAQVDDVFLPTMFSSFIVHS